MGDLLPNIFSAQFWRKTWQQVKLGIGLFRDQRVPTAAKAMLGLFMLYLISPLDLIPDFIPILGQLDDLAWVILAITLFVRLAPPELVEEYKQSLNLDLL